MCEYTQQTNMVNYDEGQTRTIIREGAPTNRSIIQYVTKDLIEAPAEAPDNDEFCIVLFG